MENETFKLPELLSPAGNLECAVAAFDGGADAVYCGLGKFNARERAANFTSDELGRLIAFARNQGRKVYLAVNTLVNESELPEVADLLAEAAALAPDALIVQDLGIVRLCREYFPSLRLHASTQMGIHNSAGVAAAAEWGIKRVILERQMTLEEVRMVALASPVELEVFIHGSLCCSLSGQCLLSSCFGGLSGNRGKCKQPCRRRFESSSGENGFLLSVRDLCGLDLVGEFRKIGIASLKIEGRLRSPDYVWKTARAYRLMLDRGEEARAEAEALLRSTASRRWSRGFYDGRRWKELIDRERPGVFGIPVADVVGVERGGLALRARERLHLGDRVRFSAPGGGDGDSFSLTRLRENGRDVLKVRGGVECFLPGEFPGVARGWQLYKIGENGFDFSRRANTLPAARLMVRLKMECSASRWRVVVAGCKDELCWEAATAFPAAEKRAFSGADAAREFAAGVPEPYAAVVEDVKIDGVFFVPVGQLKALRREFWSWAASRLHPEELRDHAGREGAKRFHRDYAAEARGTTRERVSSNDDGRCFTIPGFVPETRLAVMRQAIQAAWAAGVRRFRVGGIHGFALLEPFPDVAIETVFPLHVANSSAARELMEHGAVAVEGAVELERTSLALLREHSPIPLIAPENAVPLLATRLKLGTPGEWRDGTGRKWILRQQDGLSVLRTGEVRPESDDGGMLPFSRQEWL